MKRSWIGFGILMGVLLLSLAAGCLMGRVHQPIAQNLRQAADFGEEEDWEKALPLFGEARCRWEKNRHWVACVADHTPMEDIDDLFAQLQRYAAWEDAEEFTAGCAALSQKITAMADAHMLSLWGML